MVRQASNLLETYNALIQKCPVELLGPQFELGMYVRARLCLLTRVFMTTREQTLVPVIDLMNHASAMHAGVTWRWDALADAMVATADRTHTVGEELLDSYGLRSNLLLNRTYGFTQHPEDEPSWTYIVQPQCAAQIFEEFLPEEHRELQIMLDSTRMEDSLCTALNAVSRHGCDATEFLGLLCARYLTGYEADARLQPALTALRRLRARMPSSCAWWAEMSNGERLASEDSVRIKMSEYLCLLAHKEAVDAAASLLAEGQCLEQAAALRRVLCDALMVLREGGHFTLASVPIS